MEYPGAHVRHADASSSCARWRSALPIAQYRAASTSTPARSGTIVLCIALWIRAKTIGEDERANAERRAMFVGLWPPMFWLIGDTVRRREERLSRSRSLVRALRK